jgi:hypothetical protein
MNAAAGPIAHFLRLGSRPALAHVTFSTVGFTQNLNWSDFRYVLLAKPLDTMFVHYGPVS